MKSEIDALRVRLIKDAEESGYHINPDLDLVNDLVEGLIANEKRLGYRACPCRLADEDALEDLDIVCPCDYRDPDLTEHGSCYCGLYVSDEIAKGETGVKIVPERRPVRLERAQIKAQQQQQIDETSLPYSVWRCRVCGYLCAREAPPGVCPICKAKKDRFEHFI
jgi:ferredoxin-thioredoxin reductase catalytic subunit